MVQPVAGEFVALQKDQVSIRPSEGAGLVYYQLSEFSDYTKEQIILSVLTRVLSDPKLFEVQNNKTRSDGHSPRLTQGFRVLIRNHSELNIPSKLTIAYNVHSVNFIAERKENDKGRFYYTHRKVDTKAFLVAHEGIPSQGILEFETEKAAYSNHYPSSPAAYSEEDLNPPWRYLIHGFDFRYQPGVSGRKTPPDISRVVLDLRVFINETQIFSYLSDPESAGFFDSLWRMPRTVSRDRSPSANYNRRQNNPFDQRAEATTQPHLEPEASGGSNETATEVIPDVPVSDIPYESVAIINADDGTGTGFLVKMKERFFLMTNIHVIAGAENVTCTTIGGQPIELPNRFFIAQDRDLALLPIQPVTSYLEIAEDFDGMIKIGDDVTVFGNEAGASVMTQCTGKVKGIGPERIETDAKFVEGNSGSPAVHHKTGKVIGIAAYYIEYEIPKADRERNDQNEQQPYPGYYDRPQTKKAEPKIRRRFAERVDNVKAWENSSFQALRDESRALSEYTDFIASVVQVALGVANESRVIKPEEGSLSIRRTLENFHQNFRNTRGAGSEGNRRSLDELKDELTSMMEVYKRNAEPLLKSVYFKQEFERAAAYDQSVRKYLKGVYSY